MTAEIAGAVHSIRLLMDVLKANKSLTNFNELVAAVAEVNADLLSAQAVALTSQKHELALTQRVGELEKEIAELKDWDREAERYQLTAIAPQVFAHRLKPGMEQGEPTHYVCTHCFSDKKKSILHAMPPSEHPRAYECPRCQQRLMVAPPSSRLLRQDP
jgi:DNA-directed RNA polymerase subunit RPC12/RpoP